MGTIDDARVLRARGEIGSLAVDQRADVIVLDGDALAPGGDDATRLLYVGGSRAVRDVIIDGRVIVRDRVPTRMDAAAVRAAAAEALPKLTARAGLFRVYRHGCGSAKALGDGKALLNTGREAGRSRLGSRRQGPRSLRDGPAGRP